MAQEQIQLEFKDEITTITTNAGSNASNKQQQVCPHSQIPMMEQLQINHRIKKI